MSQCTVCEKIRNRFTKYQFMYPSVIGSETILLGELMSIELGLYV